MAHGVVRHLWHLIRLPALVILLALEPFIRLLLVGAALIGVFAGVLLRCSGDLPDFPFWEMLTFSIVALLLLTAYHMLIAILSR